jgi:hypothetical protein
MLVAKTIKYIDDKGTLNQAAVLAQSAILFLNKK